jgi:hypothetical protein
MGGKAPNGGQRFGEWKFGLWKLMVELYTFRNCWTVKSMTSSAERKVFKARYDGSRFGTVLLNHSEFDKRIKSWESMLKLLRRIQEQ